MPGSAGNDLFAEDFRLVAEILSRAEIELKLRRYREGANNLYVLLIEPGELRVEIHARSRSWQPHDLVNSADRIDMPEFGLSCTVEDLYRDTAVMAQSDELGWLGVSAIGDVGRRGSTR